MKQIFVMVCTAFLLFASTLAQAQQQRPSIVGRVISASDTSPLIGATIILQNIADSSKQGQAADENGRFRFMNVANGEYLLKVSYIGYQNFSKRISYTGEMLRLGKLQLSEGRELQTVVVSKKLPPATQKGDTTEMSASSVKTHKDANAEDLVTKMPGVMMQNGTLQAQGENVKEVLVDGKPFFSSDPTTVLRNLPAEMIDKVQVFDKQSEQSQFSGFNDGNTSKTINIVTRPDMRNAVFGKAFAGYGDQDRFSAGGNVNIFNGDRRISVLGLANNINEQNFAVEDIVGATSSGSSGGGGMGRMMPPPGGMRGGGRPGGGGGGSDISDFLVNQSSGITKSFAVGVNYADKWSKNTDVTASYFINSSQNNALSTTSRQYVSTSGVGQFYSQNSSSYSKNLNHKFNMRIDHKIDSSNSIMIRPKLTLQTSDGNSNLYGQTSLENNLLNNTRNDVTTNMEGLSFSNELLFRHKFAKVGRTYSVGWNTGYTNNTGKSYLYTGSNYYEADTTTSEVNQFSDIQQTGWTNTGTVSYTEPLSTKSFLQATGTVSYKPNDSDKRTWQYDNAQSAYSTFDTTLSSKFESYYLTRAGGLDYRFQTQKVEFNAGAQYQRATLHSDQTFPSEYKINRAFENILPTAMFKYNFSKRKNIRINYRTSTNSPSISQLQEVVNNSNALQLSTGNAQLRQTYQQNLFGRFMSSSVEHSNTMFLMFGSSFVKDYIGNSTIIASKDTLIDNSISLKNGSQLTRPVNLKGYYDMRSFFMYGVPVSAIKSNVNLTASFSYTHTPGSINGRTNYAKSPSLGLGVMISSNVSEKVDFSLSSQTNRVEVTNTLQKQSNSKYWNQSSRGRATITFPFGLVLQTDLQHQYYSGLSSGYNQNYLLWNAYVAKKFLRNQAGELKLSAFDLLKQNNSVQRNITETYYEDVQTTVLQRYFMLTFTYKIKGVIRKPVPAGASKQG